MFSSSSCSTFRHLSLPQKTQQQQNHKTSRSPRLRRKAISPVCLKADIAEIAQNKVLIAATLSAAIGQLSKPFTSSLFYGKKVDFRMLFSSGGFPSTHSSGVVAAATSIGLERGFSDSIFGMTVIFAAIVMYDAQAVRREVGKHAKLLNKTALFKSQNKLKTDGNIDSLVNGIAETSRLTESEALAPQLSVSENKTTYTLNSPNPPLHLTSEIRPSAAPRRLANDDQTLQETYSTTIVTLEESIGHTLTEVIAGASLGLAVTLGVYNVL